MMKAILTMKDGTRREVAAVFVPGDGGNRSATLDFIEPVAIADDECIDVQIELGDTELSERIRASLEAGPLSIGCCVLSQSRS